MGETGGKKSGATIVRVAVQLALFAAVVYYVGRALAKSLAGTSWGEVHFEPMMTGCAILSTAAIMAFAAMTNHALLASMGHAPRWTVTAAATWLSRVGKYLPGKVMSVAGVAYFLKPFGVPSAVAAAAVILNTALTVLVGLMASAPLLFVEPGKSKIPLGWLWGGTVFAGGLVAVHPRVIVPILNFALKLTGHEPLAVTPGMRHYARPVVYIAAQWTFTGLAVWFVARAVSGASPASIPLFVSTSALGVIVGFLALFAPGGLGVREGVLLAILSPVVGAGTAAVVAIASRLIMLCVEAALAVVGFLVLRAPGGTRNG